MARSTSEVHLIMLKSFSKFLLGSSERRLLLSNTFSLGFLQAINQLLPVLITPYLVRILGPEYFGLIAFVTSVVTFFLLLTDYGFNASATRQVAIYRDDLDKVNEIFSAVMTIKVVLVLLSLAFMSLMVFSFDKFAVNARIYFIMFIMVLGQALFPTWLFQGKQRIRDAVVVNTIPKILFTGLIFVFVIDKSDYWIVPLLTSLGFLFAGLFSLMQARRIFAIKFSFQPYAVIKYQLVDGWHVFFSSISTSLYTTATTFILGIFATNLVVGYFAAADKLIQLVKGVYVPVMQAIFPLTSRKFHHNKKDGFSFIKRITLVVGLFTALSSVSLFIFADILVDLFLGPRYQESIMLVRIMAFIPLITFLSNILGIQIMLNLGAQKAFGKVIMYGAIIGASLSLIVIPVLLAKGTCLTLLIVELFITISMAIFVTRNLIPHG